MKHDDITTKLRLEIKKQLSEVTQSNSPAIWGRIHNSKGGLQQQGYLQIEALVIQKMISGQLTSAAAVPQVEMELNFI